MKDLDEAVANIKLLNITQQFVIFSLLYSPDNIRLICHLHKLLK
jgi:hypothetical protein